MSTTAATHLEAPVAVLTGDLDLPMFKHLRSSPILAWDIETTGLDWQTERLGTVQIHDRGNVVLVRHLDPRPRLLQRLLEDQEIPKLFHHAMFDLRFLATAWRAHPRNVACTKLAAKLLRIPHADQSLAPLLNRYLGIQLDKAQQVSNWIDDSLSDAQLQYAAGDVCYLEPLMACLRKDLDTEGLTDLADACFAHLPTRVALEVQGFEDVFVY